MKTRKAAFPVLMGAISQWLRWLREIFGRMGATMSESSKRAAVSGVAEESVGADGSQLAGFSRRGLIGVGAAALGLATAAAQAQSYDDTKKGEASLSDPGPKNAPLDALNKNSVTPPPTDHGSVPEFWHSFSLAHRRVEQGGWARQVNEVDFPLSKSIASVNMRLEAGGVRELHWHKASEWALMLTGTARLTAIDYEGHPFVKDVKAGDLWYFPAGLPHSIQGLGPDGCEFLLVFDDGKFSEEGTTLLTDWLIHTPREVVAKNFATEPSRLKPFDAIAPSGRYIFPAPLPPALPQDQRSVGGTASSLDFSFAMLDMPPTKRDASGEIRIVDSSSFKVSTEIAMAHVRVKPGAMRELHWHPNAAEWQYYIAGQGRMTVFANHSDARTMDFRAGDVGYIPVTLPHYIENTGSDDLVFLEMFKSPVYRDVSLNNWLAAIPQELVEQHLSLSRDVLAAIPKANNGLLPTSA